VGADSRSGFGERRLQCRLAWEGGRATVSPGVHVLGRDHEAEVVIDATTVSRRHARLTVAEGGLTLEDLGSRNGTWVGEKKVERPVGLEDGVTFKLGSLEVTLRLTRLDDPTDALAKVGRGS